MAFQAVTLQNEIVNQLLIRHIYHIKHKESTTKSLHQKVTMLID